ncbi:hypothetical protein TNCV_2562781 [Trichonephila clavipes]|uniref:Uncharacterized protein n=1 Tax=Trichonephila clavipes TaxID=2585209 RepID=A0A8X6R5D0_TRICX|nr:hypothetical protein TNCV_2562781 [Trichonephila clavipes]
MLLLFLWLPDRRCRIETHEIHHGKELDVRLSLSLALSTIQVTIRFGPNFESEHPGGSRGLPPLFSSPQLHKSTCGSRSV